MSKIFRPQRSGSNAIFGSSALNSVGAYDMYSRLVFLGYSGSINSMFLKFLQDRGATSSNLVIAQIQFLDIQLVTPGAINERWFKYWSGLGLTGTYSDMKTKYWTIAV